LSTNNLLNTGRRLSYASTEDFVSLDAEHWAIEPFIPINTSELIDTLIARWGTWAEGESSDSTSGTTAQSLDSRELRAVGSGIADLLHHRYRPLFSRFAQRYADLDPDRDTRPILPMRPRSGQPMGPISSGGSVRQEAGLGGVPTADDKSTPEAVSPEMIDVQRITDVGRIVLKDAGYTELDREELESSIGVYSHWGVPLHVDFNVFDAIVVYARGDVVGKRSKRMWQKLYREVVLDVSLYQRVVVMFKLREGFRTDDDLDDNLLHLRMFKNIPKQDIDMLLPGTRVKFSWFDHMRNLVPSVGGISVTLFKIARVGLFVAAITFSIAAVLAGLFIALVGYMIRSVVNHRNAKNRYMLNLTRSLYYQKLDSNAGVACRLLEEAETQRHRECILAYYAILSAGEPISMRRFRRRVERMVREMVDVEIEYRATDALELLTTWGLIQLDDDGRLQTCPPDEALKRIGEYWDSLFK
jgi:hypothetical protein